MGLVVTDQAETVRRREGSASTEKRGKTLHTKIDCKKSYGERGRCEGGKWTDQSGGVHNETSRHADNEWPDDDNCLFTITVIPAQWQVGGGQRNCL